jgi:hypothetical protein
MSFPGHYGIRGFALALIVSRCLSVDPSPAPQVVYLHASYNSLSKVDPVSKNFHSDFYFDCTWVDDTFANQSVVGESYDSGVNWMPLIEILNAENGAGSYRSLDWSCFFGPAPFMSLTVLPTLTNSTWIQCTARVVADFSAEMQLQVRLACPDFPTPKIRCLYAGYVSLPLSLITGLSSRHSVGPCGHRIICVLR